jgi:hypothetical protein
LFANKVLAQELTIKTPSCKRTIDIKQATMILDKISLINTGASMLSPIIVHTLCTSVLPIIRQEMIVKDLKEHTSADSKTNSLGDVECKNSNEDTCFVFEVKHNVTIDETHIATFYTKLKQCSTKKLQAYIVTSKPIVSYVTDQNIVVTSLQSLVCQWLSIATLINESIVDEFVESLQEKIMGYTNTSLKTKQSVLHIFKEILGAQVLL